MYTQYAKKDLSTCAILIAHIAYLIIYELDESLAAAALYVENNYWRTSLLLSLRIHGKTNSNKIKMDNTIARTISIFVADVCTMCGKIR